MNLIGRSLKVCNWLLFGKNDKIKEVVLDVLVKLAEEGKNCQVTVDRRGAVTFKYKKEF